MLDVSADFGPFEGKAWLNCAHQGALPRVAVAEVSEAVAWKQRPYELTPERFRETPARLRRALGRLIDAPADEIILANSASYGLHLIANGFPWREGDEVLLVRDDFPSDLFPWLALEDRGVTVRFIAPADHLPDAAELRAALTPRTRLFCTTWVHSFSGVACNLDALGVICRQNGTTFVVNGSQAIGTRPFNIAAPVDAIVSVGFKWLCGPYGTGFLWVRPKLLASLQYNQAYWLTQMTADDLGKDQVEVSRPKGPPTARTFDIFGTANFFNFKPWAAAIEYLLNIGIERVAEHNAALVEHFLDRLDPAKYDVLSPREGPRRSTLVFISHKDRERNRSIYERLRESGLYVAFRAGKLRLAPHIYNTIADLERALEVLNSGV